MNLLWKRKLKAMNDPYIPLDNPIFENIEDKQIPIDTHIEKMTTLSDDAQFIVKKIKELPPELMEILEIRKKISTKKRLHMFLRQEIGWKRRRINLTFQELDVFVNGSKK